MKRKLFMLLLCISALAMNVQAQQNNRIVIHKDGKSVVGYDMNSIDSLSFDYVGEVKANLSLVSTASNSAVIDIQRSTDCNTFYLAYEPATNWDGYGTVADRVKEIKHTLIKVDGQQNLLSLQSGVKYNVYTLGLDKYDIEGETSMITMDIGTGDEDMFTVTFKNITCNNIGVNIKSKDQNMYYSWMLHTKEHYDECIEKNGSMNAWDIAWWQFVESLSDETWQQVMKTEITQGETDEPYSEWLYWDTDYVVTVYGIDSETGAALTKTMVVPQRTPAPTPSSNVITAEIGNVYHDGVDVKITTTNNDTYIVGAERKEYVDYYTQDGTFIKQWLGEVHENSTLLHNGDESFKKTVQRQDTDYYLIIVGLNGGPTTEVQLIPFHTTKNN